MDKKHIEDLIKEDVKSLGCDIWGLELIGSVRNPKLRIFIDNQHGITIEDCEKVSKHISKLIEINQLSDFSLEVSSPGLERKFFKKDQYVRYLGSNIKIRYKGEEERYVTTNGILNKVTEEGLYIESIKEDLFICFNNIEKANLLFTEVRDAK